MFRCDVCSETGYGKPIIAHGERHCQACASVIKMSLREKAPKGRDVKNESSFKYENISSLRRVASRSKSQVTGEKSAKG